MKKMMCFVFGLIMILVGCGESHQPIKVKKLVKSTYVDPLVEFEIFYKDGNVSSSKATSVVYSTSNDNIYFLGQFGDTLQVLPKVIVEDIQEKTTKIKKKIRKNNQ